MEPVRRPFVLSKRGIDAMARKFPPIAVVVALAVAIFSPARAGDTSNPKVRHFNGSVLLAQLKRDDTYAVGEVAHHMVIARVQNGRVVNMEADGLPMRRIKINAGTQDALQAGYCFKSDRDYTCFWYAASDVNDDDSWLQYDPEGNSVDRPENSLDVVARVADVP
jgi:hypothetical protein